MATLIEKGYIYLMEKDKDVAVVMITCEKFQQAWDPFFTLFEKYWPDCPYKVYMITDFGEHPFPNMITIGKDMGFSSNLKYGLSNIPEEYIIYFQEDYFFMNVFNTEKIREYVEYMKNNDVGCVRLAPCPDPTAPSEKEDLGALQPGDDYRISTQTAIWNKKLLDSLLFDGETGGDFEIKGSKRVNKMSVKMLSTYRDLPNPVISYYITGIVRGTWQDGALELLKKEKIPTDHIRRKI